MLGGLHNFFIFICFVCGIVIGQNLPFFWLFLVIALILLILTYLFYKKNKLKLSDISLLLLFVCLGSLFHIPTTYKDKTLEKLIGNENEIILCPVSLPEDRGKFNVFKGEIRKIGGIGIKFKVRVRDYTKTMQYKGWYNLKGSVYTKKYYGRKFYNLKVSSINVPIKLPLGFWHRLSKKTGEYILNVFSKNCDFSSYCFLSAIFLGRRELLGDEKTWFANAGVSHLIAISGLHLGMTAVILFFVLRFFNIKFRLCLGLSLILLYFYTFLVGSSSSTLRALFMYSIFALSFFMKRKSSSLNSLALSGLLILGMDTSNIFNVGFQLSFFSVLGIILGYKIFKPKSNKNQVSNNAKHILLCSFFVSIWITPLISFYFGKIYLLSIFYNVLLIPFFTFILSVNFLLIIFCPLIFVSQSVGNVLSVLIHLFNEIVIFLGSIKYSFISYTFTFQNIILYYCLIIFLIIVYKKCAVAKRPLEGITTKSRI